METREKLENRIRYKNRAVWLLALSWIILSGIFFYLFYEVIDILGVYVILSLITFVLHLGVGFMLKAPTLLIRNFVLYPFGIAIAIILNEISARQTYVEADPIDFGIFHWMLSFGCYIVVYMISSGIIRLAIGYETILHDPVSSQSYYLKSAKKDVIELLADFISKFFTNVSAKIVKEKELTWMKISVEPNHYAIAFVSKNGNDTEVNFLAYRMRSDVLCEADKEEADIFVSTIDTLFTTRKKQGYIDEWRVENEPEHVEETKKVLLKTYTAAAKFPLKLSSIRQIKRNSVDWIKRNKKQFAIFILGIASTVIGNYIIQLLG